MNTINFIATVIIIILITSCSHNLDFNEILQKESKFMLTVHQNDQYTLDSANSITITKDSKKIKELTTLLNNNSDDWESSIASWAAPDYFINGDNFRLLVYHDFIVIGFTDKKGKPRQYTKKINKSEFNFLLTK